MGICDRSMIVRLTLAGLLTLGLAACGSAASDGSTAEPVAPTASGPAPSALSSASSPAASPAAPSKAQATGGAGKSDKGPSAAAGDTTLTGDLQQGVEGNCVLLRTPDRLYLLIGGDRSMMQGSRDKRVTVTGKIAAGMMTTCQQGTPFRVTQMRPA
jgi:hypothetical protein